MIHRRSCLARAALAGVMTLIVSTSARWPVARAAPVEPLLPDDCTVVVSVNLRGVLASPVVTKTVLAPLRAKLAGNAEAREILRRLEFDPFRDLGSVTVAAPARGEGIVIVRGRFHLAKWHAFASEGLAVGVVKGMTVARKYNQTVYTFKTEPPVTAVFLDREVLVLTSDRNYLAEVIAKSDGTRAPGPNQVVGDLIRSVDDKGRAAWAVAVSAPAVREALAGSAEFGPVAQGAESARLLVGFGEGVLFEGVVRAADRDRAETIHHTLAGVQKNLTDVFARFAPFNPVWHAAHELFRDSTVKRRQTEVVVTATLGGATLEEVVKKITAESHPQTKP